MVEDHAARDSPASSYFVLFFHFVVVGLENHFGGIIDCCHDILIICTAEELTENNIPATAVVAT